MKRVFAIILIIFDLILFVSCENKKDCFVIIDNKKISDSFEIFSVYTADTNWNKIEQFSHDLVSKKTSKSMIVFYNSIQENFKFKENGAYRKGAYNFVIAKYGFCPDSNDYILAKYPNRFKINLEIKQCE
jgi:hypothetical protein